MLEAGCDLLIFDYIAGSSDFDMCKKIADFEQVMVFVSHSHADHYQESIMKWAEWKANIQYILSDDISDVPNHIQRHMVSKDEHLTVLGWEIQCFGSTDLGVSFDIQKNGRRFFHAGDLNDWHWLAEESVEWTKTQAVEYRKIIKQIPKQPAMDVVFFPVDPRMQIDYYRGARTFAREFQPYVFMPMHFGQHFLPPKEFWTDMNGFTDVKPLDQMGQETRIVLNAQHGE